MTNIQLVLVDDWELRGDGSGDMRAIQFETLRGLLRIYEQYGLRASINAEVMQQLHHRVAGKRHPHLQGLADEWEQVVRDATRRGHDVQLHLHSQWLNARYDNGRWELPGPWSITSHRPLSVRTMIRQGVDYLEGLLRPVRPDYACVSFRAGAWSIAPSDHVLSILADEGIGVDISMVNGIKYRNEKVQLDYSRCEEPFLPYYPDMRDARRVASTVSPIVCLPTFSFPLSPGYSWRRDAHRVKNLVRRRLGRPPLPWPKAPNETSVEPALTRGADYAVWRESGVHAVAAKLINRIRPQTMIADVSNLNAPLMDTMLTAIRRAAAKTGWPTVPVVLENHTKDIGDFGPIEHLAKKIADSPDLEVITLTELHANLRAGLYRPRLKTGTC